MAEMLMPDRVAPVTPPVNPSETNPQNTENQQAVDEKISNGQNVEENKGKQFGPETNDLMEIGKPCGFNSLIDPNDRMFKYLRSKMSVVDLIPCDWGIDLIKAMDNVVGAAESQSTSNLNINVLLPKLGYTENINDYKTFLDLYKVEPKTGVRLYITDESVGTDEISNEYDVSFFSQLANSLSDKFGNIRQSLIGYGRSTSSSYDNLIDKVKAKIGSAINPTLQDQFGEDVAGKIGNISSILGDVIFKGNKFAFPKIWSNSNYTPNFNCAVKLVSPYGDPKCIREFIIKPLIYLIMLGSPFSKDGVTYGYPFPLTVRAYGINYMMLATLNTISLRRGGNDTSYNVYKQPLSIDVSVTFNTLIDGFAVLTEQGIMNNETTFDKSGEFIDTNIPSGGQMPLLTTLGRVIDSLRPVKFDSDLPLDDDQYYNNGQVPNFGNSTKPSDVDPVSGNPDEQKSSSEYNNSWQTLFDQSAPRSDTSDQSTIDGSIIV